jgi:colanic acid/amylovoran biosynthesis protein
MSRSTSGAQPTRILITNVHSVRNAGDHVLLQVALEQLYARFPGAQITLAMNDPASYPPERPERVVGSFTQWVKPSGSGGRGWRIGWIVLAPLWLAWIAVVAAGQRFWGKAFGLPRPGAQRDLLRAYAEADVVVSCAGNFLYSSGLLRLPLLLHLLALVYGAWMGKPVYMLPQTLGPFRAGWEVWLLKWALRQVQVVMVRDQLSMQLLQRGGSAHPNVIVANVIVAPDIAFLYRGHEPSFVNALRQRPILADPQNRPPLLGVTLINWQAQHDLFAGQAAYELGVAAAIRHFVTRYNGVAVLFAQVLGPNLADDDRVPARRVAALLADLGERVIQIDEELSPAQLKAGYGAVDIFLGSRLHANIFALCEGRPVLAIAYQYKTHGIMQMLGLGEWVIDIEEVTGERICPMLDALWTARVDVAEAVRAGVDAVQADARRAVEHIQRDARDGRHG